MVSQKARRGEGMGEGGVTLTLHGQKPDFAALQKKKFTKLN